MVSKRFPQLWKFDISNTKVAQLQMVLQFLDSCINCGSSSSAIKKTEMDRFINKYMSLDHSERLAATTINQTTITEQLACLIPCVGCRRRLVNYVHVFGPSKSPTLIAKSPTLNLLVVDLLLRLSILTWKCASWILLLWPSCLAQFDASKLEALNCVMRWYIDSNLLRSRGWDGSGS